MPNKRPNIIFCMTDDHAAHAISAYGSNINETPNLDRLANEGALFNNCFCTNSICAPSRAAILTGTYNHVNGVTTLNVPLDNTLPNVAKELQSSGYQTAIFGKWHLGGKPENLPSGFDEFKVLHGQGPYFDPVMTNEKLEEENFQGYTTDIITDLTMDYISRRDKERPFFIKYHHKAPHRHWEPDDKHKGMYKDKDIPIPDTLFDDYEGKPEAIKEVQMKITEDMNYTDLKCVQPEGTGFWDKVPHPKTKEALKNFFLIPLETNERVYFETEEEVVNFKYQRYIKDYLRCVASVDDNMGRLLDHLEAEGILDETVIIYTSDQGFFLGDHGWFDKRLMYEESLRMPLLIRYPKEIKAGTVVDEICTNIDIPAAFADWAGIKQPEYFQGHSFRPLTQGLVPDGWQQAMYYRYWMHLAHHYVSAHYGIRTKRYKLIYYYGESLGMPGTIDEKKPAEWELFDLDQDPKEMRNVYHEPSYAETIESLKKQLHQLQANVGDKPVAEVG